MSERSTKSRERLGEVLGEAVARGRQIADIGRQALAERRAGESGPSPHAPSRSGRGRVMPPDPGPVPITGIDHLEWYVGNAALTAGWLERLGFTLVARQGPDTGVQDLESLLLAAGDIRLLVSTGLTPNHDVTRSVAARGDAIHDVAFAVADVETAYARILHCGLEPDHLPVHLHDERETGMSLVPLTTRESVLHTMLARDGGGAAAGPDFAPGFVAPTTAGDTVDTDDPGDSGITRVAAVTTVVAPGSLDAVIDQHTALFALTEVAREERDGALVVVLAPAAAAVEGEDGDAVIAASATRYVYVSPGERRERNHLDDFLVSHGGPGVRTVTFATDDLDATLAHWRGRGVRFLETDAGDVVASVGDDGSRVARAATLPLQQRSPIVLAIEQAGDGVRNAIDLAFAEERALARERAAHPAAPPLGTWGGGR